MALAGVTQGTECQPVDQRVFGSSPVRVHAWVLGQVPSRGRVRGNHTLMFLSLPSPLSKKNKYNIKRNI